MTSGVLKATLEGIFRRKEIPMMSESNPVSLAIGELNAAMGVVRGVQNPTCCAMRTLNELHSVLTNRHTNFDYAHQVRVPEGDLPVSSAEVDEALSEIGESVGAKTLATLKRARDILAQAEAERGAMPVQYLTLRQAKALEASLHDLIGWVLGAMAEEFSLSSPSRRHLLDLLARSAKDNPPREKLYRTICKFDASKVPARTQEEWLRYQSTGSW